MTRWTLDHLIQYKWFVHWKLFSLKQFSQVYQNCQFSAIFDVVLVFGFDARPAVQLADQ